MRGGAYPSQISARSSGVQDSLFRRGRVGTLADWWWPLSRQNRLCVVSNAEVTPLRPTLCLFSALWSACYGQLPPQWASRRPRSAWTVSPSPSQSPGLPPLVAWYFGGRGASL